MGESGAGRARSGDSAGTSDSSDSSLWCLPDGLQSVAMRDLGETPEKRVQVGLQGDQHHDVLAPAGCHRACE